jgi:hypothetical protein
MEVVTAGPAQDRRRVRRSTAQASAERYPLDHVDGGPAPHRNQRARDEVVPVVDQRFGPRARVGLERQPGPALGERELIAQAES